MRKVICVLLMVPFIWLISCSEEVNTDEVIKVESNSTKDVTPLEFAENKLVEALHCTSERELESVIINFEQFISVLTSSGDQGKMVAKNIMQQPDVTTKFYDDFIVDSYSQLKKMKNLAPESLDFEIEETKTEMNLTMHRIVATDPSDATYSIEVIEANGFFYLGQIRG